MTGALRPGTSSNRSAGAHIGDLPVSPAGEADTGPTLFLQRLNQYISLPLDVLICNPSLGNVSIAKRQPGRTLIARLDGTSYYDLTGRNLVGLLEQRKPGLRKPLRFLGMIRRYPAVARRWLNAYLDRGALWLIRHADGIVFQSTLSRKMHEVFLGYAPGRVPETVIMNGVSTEEFSPKADAPRLEGRPAVLISASVYRLHKRLQHAIELVNCLARDYPQIRLHVLGKFDPLVETLLPSLDTRRCDFHGRVPASMLSDYYRGADIQLSLSLFDPCPNVVCEGLASGLPVLTPAESGAAELVGDENDSWVVREGIPLTYHELQTAQAIPAVPVEKYIQCFEHTLHTLPEQRDRARARAEQALDIQRIAKLYDSFVAQIMQPS